MIDLNDYSGQGDEWFGDWHAELARLDDAPACIRFAKWGFVLVLSRDAKGAYSVLDVGPDLDPSFKPSLDALDQLVAQLPDDALTVLRVSGLPGSRAPLKMQLARTQTRLQRMVIAP